MIAFRPIPDAARRRLRGRPSTFPPCRHPWSGPAAKSSRSAENRLGQSPHPARGTRFLEEQTSLSWPAGEGQAHPPKALLKAGFPDFGAAVHLPDGPPDLPLGRKAELQSESSLQLPLGRGGNPS